MSRVKCKAFDLRAQIVHNETPLPRSVAQSHEATRRCAALNSCVALANSRNDETPSDSTRVLRRHISLNAEFATAGGASRNRRIRDAVTRV
jgi:hypothetical protein